MFGFSFSSADVAALTWNSLEWSMELFRPGLEARRCTLAFAYMAEAVSIWV